MSKLLEVSAYPNEKEIDFLTRKIDEEAEKVGINEKCGAFSLFMKDEKQQVIAGANGYLIYGSIYTDQLWVDEAHRNKGYGQSLMERVHKYGLEQSCQIATVCTFSFQKARDFYLKLGYEVDLERTGYTDNSHCIFLSKRLV